MKKIIVGLILLLVILAACAKSPSIIGELDPSGALTLGKLSQSGNLISLSDTVAIDGTNRYTFEYCCSPESSLIVSHSGTNLALTIIQPSGTSIVNNSQYIQQAPLPKGVWSIEVQNVSARPEVYILIVSLK